MVELSKVFGLLLFSALKFFLAPSTTIISGYGFWETIIITISGGFIGFVLFFKFGEVLQKGFQKIVKPKARKKFSKRNKLIVRIKRSYGLWGLAILTPCLLGIPLGALLASAYYRSQKGALWIFFGFIVIWSFILTGISFYFKTAT
tara:strand:+ start:1835 stop:2272 length:438 start_codon:yes stop_codon:yes gene_type:complete